MKFIIGATLMCCFFFLSGCGEVTQNTLPKELFFRGNIVIHKLDNKRGIVVGKEYIKQYGDGTAHDVWKYEVRFSSPDPQMPYQSIKVYEFELIPTNNNAEKEL
jgi:hypothetical protein